MQVLYFEVRSLCYSWNMYMYISSTTLHSTKSHWTSVLATCVLVPDSSDTPWWQQLHVIGNATSLKTDSQYQITCRRHHLNSANNGATSPPPPPKTPPPPPTTTTTPRTSTTNNTNTSNSNNDNNNNNNNNNNILKKNAWHRQTRRL